MTILVDPGGIRISSKAISRLLNSLDIHLGNFDSSNDICNQATRRLLDRNPNVAYDEAWHILRAAYEHRMFDRVASGDIPIAPYDLDADVSDTGNLLSLKPRGFECAIPQIPLRSLPTDIAGRRVDFPLGLPASILGLHADWIEFFVKRGFCILTTKTVRSIQRDAHPPPNWMFVRGDKIGGSPAEPTVIAERGYWPADHQKISMANSFGVPSFDPAVWERDLGRSRAVIQEGHQVLIASVVASVDGLDAITEDFVDLALRAQRGGADIIELNYSCPNTRGEFSGEVYQQPKAAAHIARAVREGLAFRQTPIFLKIGYLPRAALAELFMAVAPYVDGIVAINTVSAVVRTPQGGTAFPGGTLGSDRQKAGVSGWAIRNLARDMTTNLVELQRTYFAETGKKVTIVSVGGITTTQEFYDRLTTGADAAAICSAAFLNPLIGLAIRRTEA